jgi:hypothetical protein
LSRSLWFTNIELRYRFLETKLKTTIRSWISTLVDAGTVRDRWQDLNFNNIKFSYGAGLRIWNQSTILSLIMSKRIAYFILG